MILSTFETAARLDVLAALLARHRLFRRHSSSSRNAAPRLAATPDWPRISRSVPRRFRGDDERAARVAGAGLVKKVDGDGVGTGYATPIVDRNRVYVHSRAAASGESDCRGLDADTGP